MSKPIEEEKGQTYYYLTVQALRMRNEVFKGGGMDKETFTDEYLDGLGDYEKRVAEKEGIDIS